MADILRGASIDRYERAPRQQTGELSDLFLLLCFMEAMALPNPASPGLVEVALLDRIVDLIVERGASTT
jgi:hypothetical protein